MGEGGGFRQRKGRWQLSSQNLGTGYNVFLKQTDLEIAEHLSMSNAFHVQFCLLLTIFISSYTIPTLLLRKPGLR